MSVVDAQHMSSDAPAALGAEASGAVGASQMSFLDPAVAAQLKPATRYHPTRFIPVGEDPLDCAMIQLEMPQGWQKRAEAKSHAEYAELEQRGRVLSAGMAMSLDRKIDYSLRVIERALQVNPSWAVSFSAGRDSTVLSHLIVQVFGAKIPHVMSNTRMERPEVLKQAAVWRDWLASRGAALHMVYPTMRPGEVWHQVGLPIWSKMIASKVRQYQSTKNEAHLRQIPQSLHAQVHTLTEAGVAVTDQCCDRLKKDPLHAFDRERGIGGHFVGIRAEEARNRRMSFIQQGALYESVRHRQWIGNPLIHWMRADIDTYLERNGIAPPFTARSGCVTCMFGDHLKEEDDLNALQQLHRQNPKLWAQALHEWGYRDALDRIGMSYREPSRVAEQETLHTEFGVSAGGRSPIIQVVKSIDAGFVADRTYDLAIQRLPVGPGVAHLHRVVRRADSEPSLESWCVRQEISRSWAIPSTRLNQAIDAWVADGSWSRRYNPDDAFDFGIQTPEVRPIDPVAALEQLNDLAVAIDRERLDAQHGPLVVRARRSAEQEARQHLPKCASRPRAVSVRPTAEVGGQERLLFENCR